VSSLNRGITVGLGLAIVLEMLGIWLWYDVWENEASTLRVDPAAMLVVITTVALGIERAIELLWTGVGMMAGSFWPLTAIASHLTSLTDELSAATKPYIVHSTAAVTFLQEKGALAAAEAKKLADPLKQADRDLAALKRSATGSQRVASYAAAASDRMNSISVQYQAVMATAAESAATAADREALARSIVYADTLLRRRQENPGKRKDAVLETWAEAEATTAANDWVDALPEGAAERDAAVRRHIAATGFGKFKEWGEVAGTTLTAVGDFLGTFKDNPGRRIVSIELGLIAGLAIAWLAGLDLYAGVQNEGVTDTAALVAASVGGILLTGVVLGLGSSPTHEVIKVVQEDKERRKVANAPVGGIVGGAGAPALAARGRSSVALQSPSFTRDLLAPPPAQRAGAAIEVQEPIRVHFR